MSHGRSWLFVVLAVLILAAMASAPATAQTRFVFANESPYDTMDPHAAFDVGRVAVRLNLYDGLYRWLDNPPKLEPWLAESHTVSPDGLTYTFKIRSGVKFHDGSALTSADVKASYERIANPPPGVLSIRKAAYSDISAIETPDPQTVVFKLKAPNASMLINFASPWDCIYSAAKLKQDPKFPERNILGTGPFKFVEHAAGSHWVGERFADYFEKDRPYLDGIELFIVPEEVTRLASFRSGELDIFRPGVAQVSDIEAMGAQLLIAPAFSYYTYSIATWKEPWTDQRIWEAVSLASDRDSSNQAMLDGRGFKGGPMPPGSRWGLPEAEMAQFPGYTGDIEERASRPNRSSSTIPTATSSTSWWGCPFCSTTSATSASSSP
jgi:peptide/nickel transport system substrate-binding protein